MINFRQINLQHFLLISNNYRYTIPLYKLRRKGNSLVLAQFDILLQNIFFLFDFVHLHNVHKDLLMRQQVGSYFFVQDTVLFNGVLQVEILYDQILIFGSGCTKFLGCLAIFVSYFLQEL